MMFSPRPFLLLLCCFLVSSPSTIIHVHASKDNNNNKDKPDDSFFLLCSGGDAAKLTTLLEAHPDWVHAATENGESCLHLTGIMGQTDVTRLLLEKGANPNVRSTFEQGLRMHPLSWNVYGNHYDNAQLLLEAGADVNADFDLLLGEVLEVVTVLDIVRMIKGDCSDFDKLEALLLQHGAKTMAELQAGTAAQANDNDL